MPDIFNWSGRSEENPDGGEKVSTGPDTGMINAESIKENLRQRGYDTSLFSDATLAQTAKLLNSGSLLGAKLKPVAVIKKLSDAEKQKIYQDIARAADFSLDEFPGDPLNKFITRGQWYGSDGWTIAACEQDAGELAGLERARYDRHQDGNRFVLQLRETFSTEFLESANEVSVQLTSLDGKLTDRFGDAKDALENIAHALTMGRGCMRTIAGDAAYDYLIATREGRQKDADSILAEGKAAVATESQEMFTKINGFLGVTDAAETLNEDEEE